MRCARRRKTLISYLLLTLAAGFPCTAAAFAGSVEVVVRDRDGQAVRDEVLVLNVVAAEADDLATRLLLRRGYLSTPTDFDGKARFDDLPAGTYAVGFTPRLRDPTLVRPSDNPFVPEPRVTLFEPDEHLQIEVELWRGVPVTAFLDLPERRYSGFRAVFEHHETGLVLTAGFPENDDSVERLLVPGVWEVRVDPRPGYLLVGLDRERVPLPDSSARLDLVADPRETWLTWTYAAVCELHGTVVEATGLQPAVHIEATLVEPGPWIDAARRRGGSVFEEVVAAVDPRDGRYEMVLPDGKWRIRPVAALLAESQPEHVDLDLAPGASGRADFTIRLEPEAGDGVLAVFVHDERGKSVAEATVEVFELEDRETPLRTGTTSGYGRAMLPGVGEGDYLVVAAHPDHLEGWTEVLEYDPRQRSLIQVDLPAGAEVRVQAFDAAGKPLADVAVSLERLGEPPPSRLRSSDVLDGKRQRTLTTDPSGRVASKGFYPGTYRATARLRGSGAGRGLMRLSTAGVSAGDEIAFEIAGSEQVDLEARLRPAARLSATLQCSDAWSLPETADVRVVRADAGRGRQDEGETVLTLDKMLLGGPGRDTVTAGPLEQGLYRLAVRPVGFDRWTWAFETHDPLDASDIQIEGVGGQAAADDDGTVDLGLFHLECGPAVDLLPQIAGGARFPDLAEVEAAVRLVDAESGEERLRPPGVLARGGRLRLRDFPPPAPLRGRPEPRPPLLEVTLVHPHLLPAPVQRWQAEVALERGRFEEIVLQVEALGGAVAVAGEGVRAKLSGADGEVREALFDGGKAEIPSLVPGRYTLRIEDAGGKTSREWLDLEVVAGRTLRLASEP